MEGPSASTTATATATATTTTTAVADSTVRSQDSSNSNESKDSRVDSCIESKHSKETLISERRQRPQQEHRVQYRSEHYSENRQNVAKSDVTKDDSNLLMFTSCGQLLLGVVLVVFGVLVLVHGASLGGSGAGLWAGAGALVAGALGVVATLATSSTPSRSSVSSPASGFSTAHLATSLVALALSNMAAITALTAVVRDSQRTPEVALLALPGEGGNVVEVEGRWAGLLASIGLLVASIAELLVSGYSCLTLTPKLCGCLGSSVATDDPTVDSTLSLDGRLKTRNMVHQWVIAQSHASKNQPIYVVQPMLPMPPIVQPPYGKFPGGFMPAGVLPMAAPAYGAIPVLPRMPYGPRPASQMIRPKHKRYASMERENSIERKCQAEGRKERAEGGREYPRETNPIADEDQVDLAQTYTGLDKRISEEFISIAMDPDRKSKASSSHGSEIGTAKAC